MTVALIMASRRMILAFGDFVQGASRGLGHFGDPGRSGRPAKPELLGAQATPALARARAAYFRTTLSSSLKRSGQSRHGRAQIQVGRFKRHGRQAAFPRIAPFKLGHGAGKRSFFESNRAPGTTRPRPWPSTRPAPGQPAPITTATARPCFPGDPPEADHA